MEGERREERGKGENWGISERRQGACYLSRQLLIYIRIIRTRSKSSRERQGKGEGEGKGQREGKG